MELRLLDVKDKTIHVPDDQFRCSFNEPLIHQIVSAYLGAGRAGTKAQKTRSEVRGGGAKPFNQKGSGRARAGTIRSPLWRKGGIIFAAKPRNYAQKVNKKMYKGALRSILSELIRLERLFVVESFHVETNKTKDLLKKLVYFNLTGPTLIVTDKEDEKLLLAARNLPFVTTLTVGAVDPVSLVGTEKVVMTVPALHYFAELLK